MELNFEDERGKVKKGDLKKIAEKIGDILEKKNEDYRGASFKMGVGGVFVHLTDKYDRLYNLLMCKKKENFEKVEDTLMDLAGYCIIGLKILEEKNFDGEKENIK